MLRDDHGDQGRRPAAARNVLGEPLEICSIKPMTGFYRDGCCNTSQEDVGSQTVCAVMTAAFLEFSKSRGNDLSTPMPAFGFPGLKPGDRGACARLVGRKHSKQIRRHVSSYAPPMRARLLTARSPILSGSRWTWRNRSLHSWHVRKSHPKQRADSSCHYRSMAWMSAIAACITIRRGGTARPAKTCW